MEATHGWWCRARTWPTKCPRCSAPVFFFHCNCGSKVFFDELGPPWPPHDCGTSWARNLPRTKDEDGGITVKIGEGVTIHRAPESFKVDASTISCGKRRVDRTDPIVAVKPEDSSGKVTIIGILREKQSEVDPVRALALPGANAIVAASLGPISEGKWGKVTVHEPLSSKDSLLSYTIWVRTKFIIHATNSKGVTIATDIHSHPILGYDAIWVCDSYEVLGLG